jgi:signal peptidase I
VTGLNIKKYIGLYMDFIEITLILVGVVMVSYLFLGQLLEVTGDSMDPTLQDKEQIIAEKISLLYKPLERGDIVIFRHPQETKRLIVKRIIGLPNEKIMIREGKVYINGERIEEEYIKNGHGTSAGTVINENIEYKIAGDAYVVMGDNREKSTDSREWGAITRELVIGRGFIVFRPISNFRFITP